MGLGELLWPLWKISIHQRSYLVARHFLRLMHFYVSHACPLCVNRQHWLLWSFALWLRNELFYFSSKFLASIMGNVSQGIPGQAVWHSLLSPALDSLPKFRGKCFRLQAAESWKKKQTASLAECWSPKDTFSFGFGVSLAQSRAVVNPPRAPGQPRVDFPDHWPIHTSTPLRFQKRTSLLPRLTFSTACSWWGRPLSRQRDLGYGTPASLNPVSLCHSWSGTQKLCD